MSQAFYWLSDSYVYSLASLTIERINKMSVHGGDVAIAPYAAQDM